MRVFAYGRFFAYPARTWERVLRQHGGERSKSGQGADLVVVGAGAASRPLAQIGADLARFRAAGAAVESERAFLRRLGLAPPLAEEPRTFATAELAARARMPADLIETMALLDVIEGDAGRFGFRALKAAIEAGRLLGSGLALPDLVWACHHLRERLGVAAPLSELSVATDDHGRIVLKAGAAVGELNGQLRLGLSADVPSVPVLIAEAAERRESGDLGGAVELLRRALAVSRNDIEALFELGSLLCERGDYAEGLALLGRATAIRPDFADAWYNIGHAYGELGRAAEAQAAYERAVRADPAYPDPLYNLGMMALDGGRFTEAIGRFEAYLALDGTSEWATKARKALALARMSLVHTKAG
jgi:tetratricopeptide (TPR) repeat protein